jgi:hypothetical protein
MVLWCVTVNNIITHDHDEFGPPCLGGAYCCYGRHRRWQGDGKEETTFCIVPSILLLLSLGAAFLVAAGRPSAVTVADDVGADILLPSKGKGDHAVIFSFLVQFASFGSLTEDLQAKQRRRRRGRGREAVEILRHRSVLQGTPASVPLP